MLRGFEICTGYEDKAIIPIRGTVGSAGYDLSIPEEVTIKANSASGIIKTGVKAYMVDDEVLKLYPRSSLFKKYGCLLANSVGIIDSDYYNNSDNEGNIGIVLVNTTGEDIVIPAGERVVQCIFEKYLLADNDTALNKDRTGGFGSTDSV